MMKKLLFILVFISLLMASSAEVSSYFNERSEEILREFDEWSTGQFRGSVGVVQGLLQNMYNTFSGPATCNAPSLSLDTVIGFWLVPTGTILVLIGVGIALMIAFGEVVQSPQLIAKAKDELFHLGTTLWRLAIIIAIILSGEVWFSINSSASIDPIYRNSDTILDAAMTFSRLVFGEMSEVFSVLISFNFILYQIFSASFPIGTSWRSMYTFDLGPLVKPVVDFLGQALQFLSLSMMEWLLHLILLCFIKKWTWSLFIPLGVLLRAIPLTRTLGEIFLSLALALAFVYPLMFLVTYESHKILSYYLIDAPTALREFLNDVGVVFTSFTIIAIALITSSVLTPLLLSNILGLTFELINSVVYFVVFLGLFMPFINIFVTLIAAKEFAKFFQIDVNFFSFLKII